MRSAPTFARIVTEHGLTFARGRRVEIEFDEEQFTGGGVFLFASVLERFLGLYASINSFYGARGALAAAQASGATNGRRGPDGSRSL